MKISEVSIRRPVFATVISLLLVILGLVSLTRLSVREYPDVEPVVVSVTTGYVGAAAAIIENKITQLIEDRVAGLEGIETLRSSSRDERSAINIEFSADRDIDAAANDIRDRVGRVIDDLPTEAEPPEIAKAEVGGEAIIYLNLSSDRMSALELTDFAERVLVDQLSSVPGVARVMVGGARRPAVRIWIDRQALAARALTVADIEAALRRENVELPAGRLESTEREFALRTDTGLVTVDEFRRLVVGRGADGYMVRLGDVARVQLGAENERSLSRSLGLPGVSLGVEQVSKANTLDVASGVYAALDRLRAGLPEGVDLSINFDRAVFIRASLREVVIALAISLTMVLVVIYAFLGTLRATLIPAVTIPVSVIATFMFMHAMGYSINVLTLLGLVLAIGLVVDDAIVVLENIFRRIEAGQPPLLAAIDGSREIGFAVVATTAVLISVFVPLSFLPGAIGRLFREFGFTLAAAVLFSSLVALSLTPAMTSRMFSAGRQRNRLTERLDRFFQSLATWYEQRLRSLVRRPWLIVGGTAAIAGLAGLAFTTLPKEFAPAEDRGVMIVGLDAPEGASLDYTQRFLVQAEEILFREMEEHGDIRRFTLRIAGGGPFASDVNAVRGWIVLTDWDRRTRSGVEIAQSLRAKLAALTGVRSFVFTPQGLGSRGFGQPLQAVIGGPDYETLGLWSDRLVALAQQNPGLVSVESNYQERKPQIRISVDRDRAAELGVSLQSVGRTLETVLGSRIVTTYVDRGREYRVILQGEADDRAAPSDLQNLYVRSDRSGELVPLSNLVRLEEGSTAVQLNRFDRMRAITISAGLAPGYTIGEAVEWFQQVVAAELPGARLSFDGEAREYLRSQGQLWTTFLFAVAVVFLVLAAQFESFKHPAIIMTTVPLAVVGAFVGLWLFNMSLNVFSQIALIMLIGISAKNGVLIVEFANQLRDQGLERIEAIVRASAVRLRPVLMTSLCTAFGSLPFLLATGAGFEQREPIGVVVFYGTTISVLLTLFVVPAVYSLVARSHRSPQHLSGLIQRLRGAGDGALSSSSGTP